MGFLKKFFSIGSRKSKKRPTTFEIDNIEPIPERIGEEQQEAVAARLLRSSSSHFAVVSEVDYASLPPLPHPINNVVQTPTASTASIASASISQRGTYTVKVGRRMHHTSTEFPNANPPLREESMTPQQQQHNALTRRHDPITPRDQSRLHGLRQDPSVASLLNMYDEHGRLDSKVFSNSPPSPEKQGRAQTRRTGSTLRQLLGQPPSRSSRDTRNSSAFEGDISWAERFLGEQDDDASSTSSLGLQTPTDTLFPHDHSNHVHTNATFSTEHDISAHTTTSSGPAISSMEVELSIVTSSAHDSEILPHANSPYSQGTTMSPQRASQIFGFLTDKCIPTERALPALPLSVPDSPPPSRFSSDTSHDASDTAHNAIPPPNDTQHKLFSSQSASDFTNEQGQPSRASFVPSSPAWATVHNQLDCTSNRGHSHSTSAADTLREGPMLCQVIVTTPETGRLRGPRPINSFVARHSTTDKTGSMHDEPRVLSRSAFGERSNGGFPRPPTHGQSAVDPFTPLPPRPSHQRKSSRASSTLSLVDFEDEEYVARHPAPPTVRPAEKRTIKDPLAKSTQVNDKENEQASNPLPYRPYSKSSIPRIIDSKPQLPPITPITPLSRSRTLFRAAPKRQTPSPASSSELSPVAKELMSNLRKKRVYNRTLGNGRATSGSRLGKMR